MIHRRFDTSGGNWRHLEYTRSDFDVCMTRQREKIRVITSCDSPSDYPKRYKCVIELCNH